MRMKAITVALDSETLVIAFDDQVDSTRSDLPLRGDAVALSNKSSKYLAFK
jgi:hypothetical protein